MIEQDRIAASKSQAEAIAATKRAADDAHRERIHAEIAADLGRLSIPGLPDVYIPSLMRSIAAGRIRHLTINY